MQTPTPVRATVATLGFFGFWTAATWYFEGRIGTFARPAATGDRLVYALLVNELLGTAAGIVLLRWLVRTVVLQAARSGWARAQRSALACAVGLALGLAAYLVQGAPSTEPVVVLNAFAQVFVVSAAEVLVCWSLVGATLEAVLRGRMGRVSTVVAALVAAALFGLYHFAHSAPFDTWPMVGLLSVVGLVTGAFFFVSRDVLATTVFHNFLGTFGVAQALRAGGGLEAFATPQLHLLGMAALAAGVLLAGYRLVRPA